MAGTTVSLAGVTKAFGTNRVLRGIELTIPAGAITVLMGANGAGKSTLVRILGGVYGADAGEVHLGEAPFRPRTPAEALRAGVVTVHQNINDGVVPDLDVASNLLLDHLADGAPAFPGGRAMRRRAREIAATVGLEVDVRRQVSSLSLADRQLVAIARAMAHDPALMILDEPTSSLSAVEAERLFDLIETLKGRGVAILYISHRISDIRRLADRIVSMRDGAVAGVFEGAPLDYAGAVRAMLGQEIAEVDIAIPTPGPPVLEMRGIVLRPGAAPFDLTCCENEVIAVTGLVGSGKSALAAALFGLARPVAGEIALDDSPYAPRSTGAAIGAGVFLCAKDRRENAVVPDFDLTRNLTLPFVKRHSRAHFVRRGAERRATRDMVARMGIICRSVRDSILTLSGGNQQKVMVARWLAQGSRVLLLDEPFQGVDIQARRDIGTRIRATAAERTTLVFVSELDEALEVADRIVVMSEHSLGASHRNEAIDVGAVMAEVVGAGAAPRLAASA